MNRLTSFQIAIWFDIDALLGEDDSFVTEMQNFVEREVKSCQ
jgi:hypothetical protein